MYEDLIGSIKTLIQKSLAIVIFLLIWEISPRIGVVDAIFIPPASTVFLALWNLIITGKLFIHLGISLQRAFIGYMIAAILAIPMGFLVGWFRTFEKYADPLLQTLRQLPVLALFPVFILVFGIGEVSKIAIIVKASFWSIFLNTVSGVINVDPLLIKSARSMGTKNIAMFRKIVLPAAIPSIFTGLRYAGTVALVVLVAAEMLGANSGLGFLVFNSEAKFEIPNMYAAVVTLTILGLLVNYVLVEIEKRASKWKEEIVKN